MVKHTVSKHVSSMPEVQERPTLIEFVLDETGSMSSCKSDTITGFNLYLEEQRKTAGKCLLTLTKFDSNGLRTPYTDLDIGMAPHLTHNTFIPGDTTNLYDAIGERIMSVSQRTAEWTIKPNVLMVVITDGGDNASVNYKVPDIQHLVEHHSNLGWTFVYLGPKNSRNTAVNLGFTMGNIREFDTSNIHEVMTTVSNSTTVYRTTRGNTATAEEAFFGK